MGNYVAGAYVRMTGSPIQVTVSILGDGCAYSLVGRDKVFTLDLLSIRYSFRAVGRFKFRSKESISGVGSLALPISRGSVPCVKCRTYTMVDNGILRRRSLNARALFVTRMASTGLLGRGTPLACTSCRGHMGPGGGRVPRSGGVIN